MSDKKHIDRIFQESFKDFETTPRPAVWKNIEKQLGNKKLRVIPMGWRYAGIAALLVLSLTLGINYFNADSAPPNQVVDTENNNPTKQKEKPLNTNNNPETIITDGYPINDTDKTNHTIANSHPNTIDEIGVEQKKSNQPKHSIPQGASSKETTIAKTINSQNENNNNETFNSEDKTLVASHSNNNKKEAIKNKEVDLPLNKQKAETILNETSEYSNIAKNETAEKQTSNTTVIDNAKESNTIAENNDVLIENNNTPHLFNTPKSNDIAQHTPLEKGEEKVKDSINKAQESLLALEDAIDETENRIEEEEKRNRWRIAPNAAPVYFSSLGEGSTIDPQFDGNAKTGDINMSFGISASYAVTEKLRIRSGVNRVNLGYNTKDVIVYNATGVTSSSLQNVRVSTPKSISDALSSNNTGNSVVLNAMPLAEDNAIPDNLANTTSNASINQTLAYIEVPLEIEYNLLNKKFGVNIIGGFSSFFLTDNKLFSETSNGSQTVLGEATNINDVSYSANFGLGLNYKMSKKIDFNLEPMFKYQINTFNNTSGDFKPFFIGVYTGFSIMF